MYYVRLLLVTFSLLTFHKCLQSHKKKENCNFQGTNIGCYYQGNIFRTFSFCTIFRCRYIFQTPKHPDLILHQLGYKYDPFLCESEWSALLKPVVNHELLELEPSIWDTNVNLFYFNLQTDTLTSILLCSSFTLIFIESSIIELPPLFSISNNLLIRLFLVCTVGDISETPRRLRVNFFIKLLPPIGNQNVIVWFLCHFIIMLVANT